MKVLVIPDVHLKPWMFEQAAVLMRAKQADRAVCLMDIPDDWDREYDIACYEETYDEAIRFAVEFPDTAWCYGNHDLSYFWHCPESGYSSVASEAAGAAAEGSGRQSDLLCTEDRSCTVFSRRRVELFCRGICSKVEIS